MSEIDNSKSPLTTDAPARATRIPLWERLRTQFGAFGGDDHYLYVHAREKAGATRAEVLEACAKGIHLWYYADAREAGATHAEVLEAHANGIHLGHYANARGMDRFMGWTDESASNHRASHAEVLEVHANGVDVERYAIARWNYGASHEVAMADPVNSRDVADAARKCSWPHPEDRAG